jgi:ketosteroid isomerase-like protein
VAEGLKPKAHSQSLASALRGTLMTSDLEAPVNQMFRLLLCTVAILVSTGAPPEHSPSAPGDDAEQIVASERAWAKAAVDRDTARMATFMSDDFVEITLAADPATNKLRWKNTSKGEWIESIRSGEEKYESVDLRNLQVYFHGDVATVTGEYSQKGARGGEDISATGAYVDTWVKKKGAWQVVSSVFP